MHTSAVISECGKYRYSLAREWDANLRHVCFIMLNPSTADAVTDDPTIRRCIGFAKGWGFGGVTVVNLFAFRATDPGDLRKAASPVGADNDLHIRKACERCGLVVAAWGVHGGLSGRNREVVGLVERVDVPIAALGLTKDGHPRHPLYVPKSAKLAWYKMPVAFSQ